jgi:DNA-binding response OmpR family regulator
MPERKDSGVPIKLVIVSRDPVSASALSFAAERRGHQTAVLDGVERLASRLPFAPSIIVLAVRAGDAGELDRLRAVRDAFADVALFITVEKPREPFPSDAVKAGAHQVIREPYNPHELIVLAERWLSDRQAPAAADSVSVGDITVVLERYAAIKNGKQLQLTKLELRLLFCLCEHSPHLTPLERLLTFGWDTLGDPDASLLKTHISHLRRKLSDAGGMPVEISSRQTVGYELRLI